MLDINDIQIGHVLRQCGHNKNMWLVVGLFKPYYSDEPGACCRDMNLVKSLDNDKPVFDKHLEIMGFRMFLTSTPNWRICHEFGIIEWAHLLAV